MKIGLIIEGKHNKTERKVLPILIDKFIKTSKQIRAHNDLFNPKKVEGAIKDLLQEHPDISKIIICVDNECRDIKKVKEEVKRAENQIKQSFKNISIHYCVVIHALETWLGTDNVAIAEYYKIEKDKVYKDISIKIQKECKSKEFLRKVLKSKYNKDFDYVRDDEKIAMKINDTDRIAKLNDSFLYFKNIVLDP